MYSNVNQSVVLTWLFLHTITNISNNALVVLFGHKHDKSKLKISLGFAAKSFKQTPILKVAKRPNHIFAPKSALGARMLRILQLP